MTLSLNFQMCDFVAIEDALACNSQCEISSSYNVLAKRIGEYFSIHSAGIAPKDSYQQQALKEHRQLHSDHGGQQGDHCQEPKAKQQALGTSNI